MNAVSRIHVNRADHSHPRRGRADPSSPIYDRGLACTASGPPPTGQPSSNGPARHRCRRSRGRAAAVNGTRRPSWSVSAGSGRAIRMSSGVAVAVSSFQMRPRDTASTTRRPTSRSTSVRAPVGASDWSFGIHGQRDKTVCLMTYWHVDRHFSSCGARRLSAAARRYLTRSSTADPTAARLGVRAAAARPFIAAANTGQRRPAGDGGRLIRSQPTGLSVAPGDAGDRDSV